MRQPLSLIALFIGFYSVGLGQTNKILSPDSALSIFQRDYPQEKVFVQTDKAQYFAGETIWMKAWCTLDGAPTFLSRILYVDLVDNKGKVIQKKMYKLDSLGSIPADFDIATKTATGNYSINAYTLWMLNFPEYIYRKDIYIYSSTYFPTPQKKQPGRISIGFFPEGGDMISDLKNRIAYKATDENGFPVEVSGYIVDNDNNKQVDFSTEHNGLGAIELDIQAGKTYSAVVPIPNSGNLSFKLPSPKEEGIIMRIENSSPNRLFVLLNRSEKNKEKYNKLRVVAQMNQQILFEALLNFEEGTTAAPINKKKLPPGIMQITIFDEQNNPLAERLAFIENYTIVTPLINADHIDTRARRNSIISFSLPAEMRASLSCAITSNNADTSLYKENNISSSMLVTSDLRGYIHNPGYYFKDKSAKTLHDLDLLLMTQGWRRFNWNELMKNNFAVLKYPVESTISIGGMVYKSDRKEVVKEGNVSFIIKGDDSTSIIADATITDKGEFLLKDVNYMTQASIAYMGTNKKKQGYVVDVKLHPSYIDSLSKSQNISYINLDTADIRNRNSLLAQYLYGRLNAMDTGVNDLGNVTVKSRKLSKEDSLNREYAGGLFLMGKSIDPGEFKSFRTVWQIIQQSVPGVTIEGNPFNPDVSFNRFNGLGSGSSSTSIMSSSNGDISTELLTESNGIAYYLNEVNVSKDVINTLTVDDIALIKVLKNEGAVLGASQGVIAFYTKKGAIAHSAVYEKTYTVEKRAGYAISKEFYSPDYIYDPSLLADEKDRRSTLYWSGKLRPARDGKYRFKFSNNDFGNAFKLVIQGIDANGQLIYSESIVK